MSFSEFIQSIFVNYGVSFTFVIVLGVRIWIKRPLQTGVLMLPLFIGLMEYAKNHILTLQTGGMINWISFQAAMLRLLYLCCFYVVLLEILNFILLQVERRKVQGEKGSPVSPAPGVSPDVW
jgi:hypothetical protein